MSIVLCEKCLTQLVMKEVDIIRSMLSEDECDNYFEPSDIKLEDLFIDDEDEKNMFYSFKNKKDFENWHYRVHGRAHLMFHPHAEDYLAEVVNMRDECIDMLYNAVEGNYEILRKNTEKNKILVKKIITKNVRKFLNSKKNKSDYYIYLTIRPDFKKIQFDEFKNKITKLFKLKCIETKYYVYEQKYGSLDKTDNEELKYPEIGNGFHIHALIKFNTNQSFGNANQQLNRSLKALKMYHHAEKYIGDEIWVDKMYYMGVIWESEDNYHENLECDYKDDPDKNLCIPFDKEFRIQHNINYIIN